MSEAAAMGYPAPLTPVSLGGCVLWLAAHRLPLSDGGAVDTWADLSGSANDVAQATAGFRPVFRLGQLNGLAAVQFTAASNHYLLRAGAASLTGQQSWTVAMVARRSSAGAIHTPLAAGGVFGARQARITAGDALTVDVANVSLAIATSTGTLTDTTNYHLLEWVVDDRDADTPAGSVSFHVDGALVGVSAVSDPAFADVNPLITIGANINAAQPFDGYLAELALFTRALSLPERRTLRQMWAEQYALPWVA